jgi:hypothetical protein
MSSQRSVTSDIPPRYTEERAPPSYTEAEEDLHVQQAHYISAPAPAALDVSTRVRHIAPPVQTPRTFFVTCPNRTPFKHSTRPGRGYTRTAVSHTAIDMSEPDLTTQPMQYSQTDIRTTPSRTAQGRRVRFICSTCIILLFIVAFIASMIYLAVTKAKEDRANAKTSGTLASTGGSLNYCESSTSCHLLFFHCSY